MKPLAPRAIPVPGKFFSMQARAGALDRIVDVVPEPGAYLLLLLGLPALLLFRRRLQPAPLAS